MGGRKASYALKNACGGLSQLEILDGSLRVPNLVSADDASRGLDP